MLGCVTELNTSSYCTHWAGHEALSIMVLVLCHQGQEGQQIQTHTHTHIYICTHIFSWAHSINALYFILVAQHIDLNVIPGQRDRIKISSICFCTENLFHWIGHGQMTYTSRDWYVYLSFLNICIFPIYVWVYTIASPMTTEVKEVGVRWWKIPSQKSLLSNNISYWVIYSSNCLENGLFQWTKWHLKLLEKSNTPPSTRQSVLFSYVPLGLLSLIPHPHRLLPRQQHPQITDWSSQNFHQSLWIKWVANMIKHTKIDFQTDIKGNCTNS